MKTISALALALVLAACRTAPTVGPLGITVGTKIQAITYKGGVREPLGFPALQLQFPMVVTIIDGHWVKFHGDHGKGGRTDCELDFTDVVSWEPAK